MSKGPKMASTCVFVEIKEGLIGQSSDSEEECGEMRWEQWSSDVVREHCVQYIKTWAAVLCHPHWGIRTL